MIIARFFMVVYYQQMTNIICNYRIYEVLNVAGFCHIELHPTNYPVRSIKLFIEKTSQSIIHRCIRFLRYIQGYGMPKILTKNLIAVTKKVVPLHSIAVISPY
jgi:hypothetical protein